MDLEPMLPSLAQTPSKEGLDTPRQPPAERGHSHMTAPGDIVGRMTILLHHNGTSRPTPEVVFDADSDVGMFTPGLIGDYLHHFASAIERAQANVRQAAARRTR